MRSRSVSASFGGGVTFKDLWEANQGALPRKYPAFGDGDGFDHSTADMTLMNMLAF